MKKNWVSVALIVAAIVLSIISWILLPNVVAVLVGISLAVSVLNLKSDGENGKRAFLLSLTGIVVLILCLLFNR